MDFGVGFQSHIHNGWKHALLAEQVGFTNAWFCGLADAHLGCICLYGPGRRADTNDPSRDRGHYCWDADSACYCAFDCHHQSACARSGDSRSWAPVIRPGGPWTCRRFRLRSFRHAVEVCRGPCSGARRSPITSAGRHSRIRFMDVEHGYINTRERIPIYLAASHPKAQALAGELGRRPVDPEPALARVTQPQSGGSRTGLGRPKRRKAIRLQCGDARHLLRAAPRRGREQSARAVAGRPAYCGGPCTTPMKSPNRAKPYRLFYSPF